MIRFLHNFELDRLSFWLGFLAGALFLWLSGKARPFLGQVVRWMKASSQAARQELRVGTEIRLRNDMLRQAQGLHLAAPLFSLDEILIPPQLMAPPPPVEPGAAVQMPDITEMALPYLPDWPRLAAIYGAPRLSLEQALEGGMHLALIGESGSGKSVALAYLVTQILQEKANNADLAQRLPLLVHAADLNLNQTQEVVEGETAESEPVDPANLLVEALAPHLSALTLPRLGGFLAGAFEEGRVLLLLDGLDELPPPEVEQKVAFLKSLLERYPQTRVVAAAATEYYDGLARLGFAVLPMAAWTPVERAAFLQHWGKQWTRHVAPATQEETLDPALVFGWMFNDTSLLSPLELTLKVWAIYAGDLLGPRREQGIEAYLRRMTAAAAESAGKAFDPGLVRQALEHLASQALIEQQPVMNRKQAEGWLKAINLPGEQNPAEERRVPPFEPEEGSDLEEAAKEAKEAPSQTISVGGRLLNDLVESGLLAAHSGDRLRFAHPVLSGYLAAGCGGELLEQPDWTGKALALQFLATRQSMAGLIPSLVREHELDFLLKGLFQAARWLPYAPDNAPWRGAFMRQLAACLQNEAFDLGLRARALAALFESGSQGVSVLFRQLMPSPDAELRQLAALGSGAVRDSKAVNDLGNLLVDTASNVRRAACLALVSIGDKAALEMVASALLNGDEDLRRFAAEALANHVEEGYPTLEEGAGLSDLLVRRSTVYGLRRIEQPWAREFLEKMQVEDAEWVVKNAATQALDELAQPNPHIPRPLPPLTETPWLIAFAGEKGLGVAPGKPANDLLLRALREGDEEQRLAAMHYLSRFGDLESILALYEVYYSTQGEVRSGALNCLWHLSSAGIGLPTPVQFGFAGSRF